MCCHCRGCAHTKKLASVPANILACPALGWESLLVSIDTPHICVFLAYAQVSTASLGAPSEPPPPNNCAVGLVHGAGLHWLLPRAKPQGPAVSLVSGFAHSTSCQLVLGTQLQRCFSLPSEG